MSDVFDIIVVGAGLVGSSAALALAKQGYQVALIDRQSLEIDERPEPESLWDSRIYAISPGNIAWLKGLGVWSALDDRRICPIDRMQVWGDRDAELTFDSSGTSAANLGEIIENKQLQQALWKQLSSAGVTILSEVECIEMHIHDDEVIVQLGQHQKIQARLIVAADGGNSWVRNQVGIANSLYEYEQSAVVANFEVEFHHGNIARQWFNTDGVLAWLPLSGKRISIVWSTRNAHALLSLDLKSLAERIADAGDNQLGALSVITNPKVFPLVKRSAASLVNSRLVLIGDAAHQIHALAGQGVNLGFRDAIALSHILKQKSKYQDIGDLALLRKYERARQTDILGLTQLTHGLNILFESDHSAIQKLRNLGLQWLDNQAIWKKRLVQQAIR
ncbi:MAG: FAD-dependent oxidoreductase [Methylophilaceae bacterium]